MTFLNSLMAVLLAVDFKYMLFLYTSISIYSLQSFFFIVNIIFIYYKELWHYHSSSKALIIKKQEATMSSQLLAHFTYYFSFFFSSFSFLSSSRISGIKFRRITTTRTPQIAAIPSGVLEYMEMYPRYGTLNA